MSSSGNKSNDARTKPKEKRMSSSSPSRFMSPPISMKKRSCEYQKLLADPHIDASLREDSVAQPSSSIQCSNLIKSNQYLNATDLSMNGDAKFNSNTDSLEISFKDGSTFKEIGFNAEINENGRESIVTALKPSDFLQTCFVSFYESVSENNYDAENIASAVTSHNRFSFVSDQKDKVNSVPTPLENLKSSEIVPSSDIVEEAQENKGTPHIFEQMFEAPKHRQTLTLSTRKSMVPFQEKELPSSPSELAYYARSCADEFSFLINEEYCNTSRLCENCYSMRRELERLANKLESMAENIEEKLDPFETKNFPGFEDMKHQLNIAHEQLIETKKISDVLKLENQILSTNLVNLRKLYFFSLKHSLNCQIKILQENEQNLRKLKEKESDDFKFLFEEAVTKRSNDGRTLRSEIIEQSKKIEELEFKNKHLTNVLNKLEEMSSDESKELKRERDGILEAGLEKYTNVKKFANTSVDNGKVEAELLNTKRESSDPGVRLNKVENENLQKIELLNIIVKSDLLVSMQNKIDEILALSRDQKQLGIGMDNMMKLLLNIKNLVDESMIMNNQKIEAMFTENRNFGTVLDNLNCNLNQWCSEMQFQNSLITAIKNGLNANEETKKASTATILKINKRCGKILQLCKKISNDRKCLDVVECLKEMIEKNLLVDENFSEKKRLVVREAVEETFKNCEQIFESNRIEENRRTNAMCSEILDLMKAIENQKNLFLCTSQCTEEKFFSKMEQERTKWENMMGVFNENVASIVTSLQEGAINIEKIITDSFFNEEMEKMKSINIELVKALKVMETKYSILEVEFGDIRKIWQEDSAISKNEFDKIRQGYDVLVKTVHTLEEKLSKSKGRTNELKQFYEKKRMVKENYDINDDDKENLDVAKQRIKELLKENNRLGDACDEADEEIEKLKNELETLRTKLARIEDEKGHSRSDNIEIVDQSTDSTFFREEMKKMNTLNTELVKILKAMETKYKMLEMEFNAVKKKWQEDSDISKNELNKIRQEREVLMKTIYALEEKLSKSDKRINELKQLKCEEKGIMKENVDAYETDDDEENLVVAKQKIKILLKENNRLGDACDEADEEIEKLKNELEILRTKLARIEDEKNPNNLGIADQMDSFNSARQYLKPKAKAPNPPDSLTPLKPGQSNVRDPNYTMQDETLMNLLDEISTAEIKAPETGKEHVNENECKIS